MIARLAAVAAVLALATPGIPARAPGATFDLLIRGGLVVDGSGSEGFAADVGIRDGWIVRVGDLSAATAQRTIEAAGLVVAPGFVDIHNHSDVTLLEEPRCESMVRQGVTTMILGEGDSAGPVPAGEQEWTTLGGYFRYVEEKGVSTNIGSYVGQTRVWTFVKGQALQPATDDEVAAMKREVARAMEEGALGLSTSLLMPPSSLVTTGQLVELAAVASRYGGLYSTHVRDEGHGVFASIGEAIAVARGAAVRVDVIHLKIAEQQLWGRMPEVVAMFEEARREGLDVRANVYPYNAGQNDLRAIIPPWAHDGGNEAMLARLQDPAARARMRTDILEGLDGWYDHLLAVGGDWERILLVGLEQPANRPFVGRRMSDLVEARGGDPVDVLFDVLLEEGGSVRAVYFHHREDDMVYALRQPWVSVGSDGSAISRDGAYADTHPHPRWYGTFPRILGRYVREKGVLTLPEAVRKITSMNAEKIGVRDRGLVREGLRADLTLFDPRTVVDRATFENPHQYPDGIPFVIVNGTVVLDRGEHTGALPGQVLRGPGFRAAPHDPVFERTVE